MSPFDIYDAYLRGRIDPNDPSKVRTEFKMVPENRTLTSNQEVVGQQITFDGDAPLVITRMSAVSTGAFRFRLGDNEGHWYIGAGRNSGSSQNRVRSENLFGTASLPFLLPVPIVFPPNGNLIYDMQDISASGNTIEIAFVGFKMYAVQG